MMKSTTALLAVLSMGAASAIAGTAPAPVSTGKAVPPPACVPPPADPCAGPISYNNVELLYAYSDWDGVSDDGNGGIFHAEYSPMENFYIALGAEYHDVANINMWNLTAGVGGYVALTENIHLAADAGVVWTSLDVDSDPLSSANNGFNEDDYGWYVRPHVRGKWGCVEVHVGAQYTDVSDFDFDEWTYFANVYYQVSPGWDLTAGVQYNNDRTTATGGVRYRY